MWKFDSVPRSVVLGVLLIILYSGGYNREECLRTVECYDPESDTWTFLPPMKTPRARFQMAVLMVCVGFISLYFTSHTITVLFLNSHADHIAGKISYFSCLV